MCSDMRSAKCNVHSAMHSAMQLLYSWPCLEIIEGICNKKTISIFTYLLIKYISMLSGNMMQSSTNCLSPSRWKSTRLLDASSRASSRNTVSWQNRKLRRSNQTTTHSPSGPFPTGQRLRLRSWSTRLPLWWPSLGGPSASFLASLLYRFGTISVPWKD